MTYTTDTPPNSNFKETKPKNENEYQVYRRRWLILILFILFSISNLVQYMAFSVIAHIVIEYYKVSYVAVDWTTLVSSIVYILISIPGTYVIDKIGIRKTIIIGIIGTCLGSWIKVASVHPDRFWLIILGQAIVSTFQICIFPVLPKLAATWFGYDQISTASAFGILGTQIGVALSFVIPPFIVSKGELHHVEKRLYIMNITFAMFATIMIPILIIFFDDAPPTTPSIAQQHMEKYSENSKSYFETFKTILSIKSYVLYLIIFGMHIGIIIGPLQILSNQIILIFYSDADYDVGIIGLLQTLLSFIGSMSTAVLLNKYKNFKITCWAIYFLFFASLIFYVATIDQGLGFVYVSSICIGIFNGAGMTLGFELMMEFTYPEAQSICIGIAFNFLTIIYLVLTILSGYMLRSVGFIWASLAMIILIFASDLLFFFLKFDLRRTAMQYSQSKSELSQTW